MLTDFQTSFTGRLGSKFAKTHMFISHHTLTMSLHYFAKYLCSKNDCAPEDIEANYHVTPSFRSKVTVLFTGRI